MLRRNWLKISALTSLAATLPAKARDALRKPEEGVSSGSAAYQRVVRTIRDTFPSPTRSQSADSRLSRLMAYAMGEYEKRKTHKTFLGKRTALDYAGARRERMGEKLGDARATIRETARYLEGQYTWSHPNVHRLHGSATSVSIIGQLYGSITDPNTVWDDLSHKAAEAEVRVSAMCAALVGYDPEKALGLFTFGGTGTTLYGIKAGAEIAQPGLFNDGIRQPMRVFGSDLAHYAKLSASAWLGLGSQAAVSVPTGDDNAMDIVALEKALRASIQKGERIAAIVVTMGTTDAFGIDDIQAVHALRKRLVDEYRLDYTPHLHADAVIGWAYAVFNDYDFAANALDIPPEAAASLKAVRVRIRHLHLADSLGIDFHKSGYTPYASSLFIARDAQLLNTIRRDKVAMPYLFQFGEYDPGIYTLECSRSGGPVLAALANLLMLGKDGYRGLLSHCVEMSQLLRRRARDLPWLTVLNQENHGAVVVIRVYPDGVDGDQAYLAEKDDIAQRDALIRHNDFNKAVYTATREAAEGGESSVFVQTSRYRATGYGEPVVGIKFFTLSAFTDPASVEAAINVLQAARRKVAALQKKA
jgi:glutamate/tyrosine decarboxylase-like PLP-dependent enzyme